MRGRVGDLPNDTSAELPTQTGATSHAPEAVTATLPTRPREWIKPTGLCIGIGGVRVDRAIAVQVLEAVSPHAIAAAIEAADRVDRANTDVRRAAERELEGARYEATLASRRYEAVDPTKRLVARELETRWEAALMRVREIEQRLVDVDAKVASQPHTDRDALLALAEDLPAVWNSSMSDNRTKQRLLRVLVREVIIDLDNAANETILVIHWTGGRHTEIRVGRVRSGSRYPSDRRPSAVEVVQKMGGQWPDRELAITMNRMRCKGVGGTSWTTVRVKELRERLGISAFDPSTPRPEAVSVEEAAKRLSICVGSVYRLIRDGVLPASQILPGAPWQVPVATLASKAVKASVHEIVERRPRKRSKPQATHTLQLPGL